MHAANDDIGTQTTHIASERRNGTISRNQQRKNVEAIVFAMLLEPGILARRVSDETECLRALPWMTVDERTAGRIERAAKAEQPVVASRCAHALGPAHADNSIADDPVRLERRNH